MSAVPSVNVLFIENSIGLGGSTVSLCSLLSALDRRLYQPYVVLSRRSQEDFLRGQGDLAADVQVITRGASLRESRLARASLTAVGAVSRRLKRLLLSAIAGLDMLFVTVPYVTRLFVFARRYRIDLIHHNNGFDVAAVALKTLLQVPMVAYQRGWEWNSCTVRRLAQAVDRWIANSETIREHLLEMRVPGERIDVVYPPVDFARFDRRISCQAQRREFGVNDGDKCFAVIGALCEYRGQRIFLKAASRVIQALSHCRAFIIGEVLPGEEEFERTLRALASQLGMRDRVVFTGYRSDVPELMQLMDVVVHPALISEPFGRVIIEAMAMRKPVIATVGGGPSEILRDGESGFLVPRADEEALARTIIRVLTDSGLARRVAEMGCHAAEARFSVPQHARAMEAVYARVLGLAAGVGTSEPAQGAGGKAVVHG